jgi:hypothetical protein
MLLALLQKCQSLRCTFGHSAYVREWGYLPFTLFNSFDKTLQRTTLVRPVCTARYWDYAIVDVDTDKCLVLLRGAINMVRIEWTIVPAFYRRRADESLQDESAAHWL